MPSITLFVMVLFIFVFFLPISFFVYGFYRIMKDGIEQSELWDSLDKLVDKDENVKGE